MMTKKTDRFSILHESWSKLEAASWSFECIAEYQKIMQGDWNLYMPPIPAASKGSPMDNPTLLIGLQTVHPDRKC